MNKRLTYGLLVGAVIIGVSAFLLPNANCLAAVKQLQNANDATTVTIRRSAPAPASATKQKRIGMSATTVTSSKNIRFDAITCEGDLNFGTAIFPTSSATKASMNCKDINEFYRLPTPEELQKLGTNRNSLEDILYNVPLNSTFSVYTNKRLNNRLTQVYVHDFVARNRNELKVLTANKPKLKNYAKGDYVICVWDPKEIDYNKLANDYDSITSITLGGCNKLDYGKIKDAWSAAGYIVK